MKYRSSTEIIDTILRSLDSGATRTRIMYKAYLSYTQLKEYLALLQSRELINYDETSQIYTITQKGLRFINAYDEIRELVAESADGSSQSEDSVLMGKVNESGEETVNSDDKTKNRGQIDANGAKMSHPQARSGRTKSFHVL